MSGQRHDVVCAVLIRHGQVLLAHRAATNDWYPDVWDLPGGHVKSGETGMQALIRELREELGVSISEFDDPPVAELRLEDMTLRIWRVDTWLGEPRNQAPEEHDTVGWFDLAQLEELELASVDYLPLLRRLLE